MRMLNVQTSGISKTFCVFFSCRKTGAHMPLISRNWMRTWSMMKGESEFDIEDEDKSVVDPVGKAWCFIFTGSVAPEEKYQRSKQSLTNSHNERNKDVQSYYCH